MKNAILAFGVALLLIPAGCNDDGLQSATVDDLRTPLSNLEMEVAYLSAKVDALESAITGPWGLESKLDDLDSSVKDLSQEISGLRLKLDRDTW